MRSQAEHADKLRRAACTPAQASSGDEPPSGCVLCSRGDDTLALARALCALRWLSDALRAGPARSTACWTRAGRARCCACPRAVSCAARTACWPSAARACAWASTLPPRAPSRTGAAAARSAGAAPGAAAAGLAPCPAARGTHCPGDGDARSVPCKTAAPGLRTVACWQPLAQQASRGLLRRSLRGRAPKPVLKRGTPRRQAAPADQAPRVQRARLPGGHRARRRGQRRPGAPAALPGGAA